MLWEAGNWEEIWKTLLSSWLLFTGSCWDSVTSAEMGS